jgi:hypothetical protein
VFDGVMARFVVAVATNVFAYVPLADATAIVTPPTVMVPVPAVSEPISTVIVYLIPA